ncbi:hypothetical protein E2C01_081913 [Portunus trituberculatus]|uniref:Secreted protein n=1 Tax=Portunus trituberculatus TaxID=210409 RepID=A0A5B7J3K7_PORTR|nr:hypothetical protein [Portunus trituberculatus]
MRERLRGAARLVSAVRVCVQFVLSAPGHAQRDEGDGAPHKICLTSIMSGSHKHLRGTVTPCRLCHISGRHLPPSRPSQPSHPHTLALFMNLTHTPHF